MEILLIILVLGILFGVGVLVVDVFQPTFLERFRVKTKVSEKEEAYYALLDKILEDAEKEDDSYIDSIEMMGGKLSDLFAAVNSQNKAIDNLIIAVNLNATNTKNTLERIEKSAKFSPTVLTNEQVDAIVKRAIETTVDLPVNTGKK